MALPARQQLVYWGVAAFVLCAVLWGLGPVLLPFLVGGAIAYFLDPVVDRLQRLGLSRLIATSLIALVVTLAVVVCGLLIIPTLIRQLSGLIAAAPDIANRLQSFITDQFPQLSEPGSVVNETLKSIGEAVKNRGGEVAQTILTSAMGVVNFAVFIIVVPVVAFYMLMDWDKIVERVDSWLPRDHVETLRAIFRDIDNVLSGFVRGQISVCIILGTFYAIALMLAGLNFGLIAGSIAGMLTFIPYVGAIIGGGLSIGLALYQFWGDWMSIGIVVGIFLVGQFLEGNIITPRFVGNSIGLHPLWLIFALSAFGTLFGFVGMLIAVPVAAMIGVLARFALNRYLHGELYLGSQRYRSKLPPIQGTNDDIGR